MREVRKKSGQTLFLKNYPNLYHVSLCPDAESIRRHGLMSTSGILDLLGLPVTNRESLERSQRSKAEPFEHPQFGKFILNDQIPLRTEALQRCLIGMTPPEWYAELNERIFFWLSPKRCENFAMARKMKMPPRTLLVLNSERLLANSNVGLDLCLINSGSATRRPAERNLENFRSVAKYPLDRTPAEASLRTRKISIVDAIEEIKQLE
jgi:hypothetical protein